MDCLLAGQRDHLAGAPDFAEVFALWISSASLAIAMTLAGATGVDSLSLLGQLLAALPEAAGGLGVERRIVGGQVHEAEGVVVVAAAT